MLVGEREEGGGKEVGGWAGLGVCGGGGRVAVAEGGEKGKERGREERVRGG